MSTGVGMSSCCLSGKLHSGTPKGHEENIGGLDVYVAQPEDGSKARSIIFISDIFGWRLNNTRLLADEYAKAGFFVYLPDFLEGDPLPEEFLQNAEPPLKVREQLSVVDKASNTAKVGATLGPWLVKHREAVAKPLIEGFFNTIRMTPGTDKIGTIGFCWGGRYSILMAHNLVDAAVACHPSLVAIPSDFDPITKPISIAVGDADSLLPDSENQKIRDIFAKKTEVPNEIKTYEDQVHGFALRGDFSHEKDKKAMDDATSQGLAWFQKYLASDVARTGDAGHTGN